MTQLTSKVLQEELRSFAKGTLQAQLENLIAGLRDDIKEVKRTMHDIQMSAPARQGDSPLRANGRASTLQVPCPPVSAFRRSVTVNLAEAESPSVSRQKTVEFTEPEGAPETSQVEAHAHRNSSHRPSVRSRPSRTTSFFEDDEDSGDIITLNPNIDNYLTEDEARVLRKRKKASNFDIDDEPKKPAQHRRMFTSTFEKDMSWFRKRDSGGTRCFRCITRIVTSKTFEYGVMLMVLANAIIIGFETEHMASDTTAKSSLGFRVCETCFCLIFTLELVLRIIVFGCDFFHMKGWEWNWADCVVVAFQLVEELTIVFSGYQTAGSGGALNFSFVRILRVLRLVRVVRIMRVLRYVGELRTLIFSISSSLKPLGWTIVLIMMMIYICSIYFTQLVTDHFHSNPGEPDPGLKHHFGSLGATFLSLFECITGGIDWDDVLGPLRREISPILAPVFCLYIAFAVLAMLNTITGVFVESSIRSARDQTDNFMLNGVREAFLAAGGGITGYMTAQALETQLNTPHMKAYFKSIDVDTSQARGLFLLLDRDGSGEIDFEEFLSGCLRLRGPTKALDLAILTHEVRRFSERFKVFSTLVEAKLGVDQPDDMTSMRSSTDELAVDSVVRSVEGPSDFFKRMDVSLLKNDSSTHCAPNGLGANMPNVPFEPAPPLQVEPME